MPDIAWQQPLSQEIPWAPRLLLGPAHPAPAGFWDRVHPATVVGGGPVGLTTALGLVRHGIPVVLVEARSTVSVGSRAICTSRRSPEILDRLGVGGRVQARSLVRDRGRSSYRDRQVLEFVMPNDERFVRPPMVNLSQADVEQHLWEAVLPLIGVRPGLRHLVDPRQSSATHARGAAINWGTPGPRSASTPATPWPTRGCPASGAPCTRPRARASR